MTTPFKNFVKMRCPLAVALWRRAKYFILDRRSPHRLFKDIYRHNRWGDIESLSGPGSSLSQTEAVRDRLPGLIRELNCKSILDIPCGDFNWMQQVELDLDYVGGDIIGEIIANNRIRFGGDRRQFVVLDLLHDELPKVDLIFCRDCLIHFSFRNIRRAIRNIKKSGSTYLVTTTYIDKVINEDIPTSAWRPINLQRPPFKFSAPIKLLDEASPRDNCRDKCLGLWRVCDLPDL